jgi:hypothetical protein
VDYSSLELGFFKLRGPSEEKKGWASTLPGWEQCLWQSFELLGDAEMETVDVK